MLSGDLSTEHVGPSRRIVVRDGRVVRPTVKRLPDQFGKGLMVLSRPTGSRLRTLVTRHRPRGCGLRQCPVLGPLSTGRAADSAERGAQVGLDQPLRECDHLMDLDILGDLGARCAKRA